MFVRTARPVRSFVLALAIAAALSPLAHAADDASRRAKVEEMLTVTEAGPAMQSQLKALADRIGTLAQNQFAQGGPKTPAQTALINQYLKEVQATVTDEVSWEKLHPVIVANYTEAFTEEQLDGIIAFYKSPAGKAMLEKTPALVGKTNALVTGKISEIQPKLVTLTESYATKIKAAGPAPAAAPSLSTPAPAAKPAAPATH